MTVTVRFAPSPTGLIHIGNARTALFNWLFALKHDGRFILRFDDTDSARSKPEYADAILEDLRWLGIEPHAIEYQSRRLASYEHAAERLREAGRLYPCYETAEELELKRKVLLSRRLPPVYGREALKADDAARAALEAEGRRPHWRFLLPNFTDTPFETRRTEITWEDLCRGPQTVDLASLSDPVLIREDGAWLYTGTSVVDDAEMGVSHVIRGADHISNTGVQIAIFEALGVRPPVFGHHNLLISARGEGLSKRTGALSIRSLREQGFEPMAVASLAVLTGAAGSVEPVASMEALAARIELSAISRSAARFDPAEIAILNRALVKDLDPSAIAPRLAALGIPDDVADAFWRAVRGNVERVEEAGTWWRIVAQGPEEKPEFDAEDRAYLAAAFDLLPPEPWDAGTWKAWTEAAKAATGRKGRALYMPLRLALTGRPAGPEMSDLVPLLGREGTLARRP